MNRVITKIIEAAATWAAQDYKAVLVAVHSPVVARLRAGWLAVKEANPLSLPAHAAFSIETRFACLPRAHFSERALPIIRKYGKNWPNESRQ
jgi:hypothetical protein